MRKTKQARCCAGRNQVRQDIGPALTHMHILQTKCYRLSYQPYVVAVVTITVDLQRLKKKPSHVLVKASLAAHP